MGMELSNCLLKKRRGEPEMELLNTIQKNKMVKVNNDLLKLEKDFRELKYREMKVRKELKDLLFKPPIPLPIRRQT